MISTTPPTLAPVQFGATASPGEPPDMAAFAPSARALPAAGHVEGHLHLQPVAGAGHFQVLRDDFGVGPGAAGPLPAFDVDVVQDGGALLPLRRLPVVTAHPRWDYVFSPGSIWREPGDGEYRRAALPFALLQKNANCVHNGVLTFLVKPDGSATHARFLIASETCRYFQFDAWGTLAAQLRPRPLPQASAAVAAFTRERAARLPVKPISALSADYPATDFREFGNAGEVAPAALTAFGVVAGGVHYTGRCTTRRGDYPFCDALVLPSYSLAKSLVMGLGTMHLALRYPDLPRAAVADYVPECRGAAWRGVTLQHLLDMTTGNFLSAEDHADESADHVDKFFLARSHAGKTAYACGQFPRRAAPGRVFVYHTADSYLAGAVLNAFLRAHEGRDRDFYRDVVAAELWRPLALSPLLGYTRRTDDAAAQPFTGYGLFLLRDDIARLADFLNRGPLLHGGRPLLDSTLYQRALRRDGAPGSGVAAGAPQLRYANGFWALNVRDALGCARDTWVPFLSGYGGISVVLFPNGVSYYYFSDGDDFRWLRAARAVNRLRAFCAPAESSHTTQAAHHVR